MRQHAGGQMQTRRVCRDIKSLPIAAELMRVAPRPGDGAAHLLVHRKQVAASLLDVDEIGDQAMRSGMDQRLGLEVIVRPLVAPPCAAVDEKIDRRVRRRRAENIESLVFARPVRNALRRTQDRARPLARGDAARDDQRPVRRVHILVVRVVERLLIQVAPDQLGRGDRLGHLLYSLNIMRHGPSAASRNGNAGDSSSGRSTLRNFGKYHAQSTTTTSTTAPPSTAEPTAPNQSAVTPDSNMPICPAQLVNSEFTANTRPRVSSGVANCMMDCRTTTDSISPAPTIISMPNDSTVRSDNPKPMVAMPYTATAANMMRPAARVTGSRVSKEATTSAPIAGALRRRPKPQTSMCRMSRAKIGSSATTPPNSVATMSSDMAPSIAGSFQMKCIPAKIVAQVTFGRSVGAAGIGSSAQAMPAMPISSAHNPKSTPAPST